MTHDGGQRRTAEMLAAKPIAITAQNRFPILIAVRVKFRDLIVVAGFTGFPRGLTCQPKKVARDDTDQGYVIDLLKKLRRGEMLVKC